MNKEQAITILIQVANLAQERGLLKLGDAVAVAQAIELVKPVEEVKEVKE